MNITNLFSIKTGNEETDKQLQKLDSDFVPRSQFVDTLDLNQAEYEEIVQYFIFHRDEPEESLVDWLHEWIATNRYEVPREFATRMAQKYCKDVVEVFSE